MQSIDFIGKGIIFPIKLTTQGLVIIETGSELIRSSIKMILCCGLRQRIFMSRFGSKIAELLEEPNDDLLKGLVEFYCFDALQTWEKRIDVIDILVERIEPEKLDVEIKYRERHSQLEDVMTFPLYRNAA